MSDFDPREFRNALSKFATGVTVITTVNDQGEHFGMTASSFNSVSIDPPLILWSVVKESHGAKAFTEGEHFCVNVLSDQQVDVSNQFARSSADKFAGIEFEEGIGGSRKLKGAICHLECSNWAVYEGGDHNIIVGEVKAFNTCEGGGLVFAQGGYAQSVPLPSADKDSDAA